jgi:hypothetical protein
MRDTKTRKADTLAALEKQKAVWLATADPAGHPHLIAASAWWDGTQLVVATRAGTKTARNMEMNPTVRVARGAPSDAIVIEAQVVESRVAKEAPTCRRVLLRHAAGTLGKRGRGGPFSACVQLGSRHFGATRRSRAAT